MICSPPPLSIRSRERLYHERVVYEKIYHECKARVVCLSYTTIRSGIAILSHVILVNSVILLNQHFHSLKTYYGNGIIVQCGLTRRPRVQNTAHVVYGNIYHGIFLVQSAIMLSIQHETTPRTQLLSRVVLKLRKIAWITNHD